MGPLAVTYHTCCPLQTVPSGWAIICTWQLQKHYTSVTAALSLLIHLHSQDCYARPGTVTHAGNPSTLWGWSRQIRSLRPAWATWWNPISTEIQIISQVWWCTLVVPATQEAEAWELLEPGRQRLQWAENAPLHSNLGDRMGLHLKIIIIIQVLN